MQTFTGEILAKTARIVSLEGVALAERQTGALFGSLEELQKELMEAAYDSGDDAGGTHAKSSRGGGE